MKFSERKGHKPISQMIQTESMNDELRNSLWNVLHVWVWGREGFLHSTHSREPLMWKFSIVLWFHYFKKPVDSRPEYTSQILSEIRHYFFTCMWYEVYDFLEFVLGHFEDDELDSHVNGILERELAGYRYVGEVFTDITGGQEVELLENALADTEFPGVRSHLESALRLLSNRENPDYRNSIKESISAVESMAQVISGKQKASLDEALKLLKGSGRIHTALQQGFSKLYGYTSDADGIRHAMLDEPDISSADAKFFLLSCTSFINYLKAKM